MYGYGVHVDVLMFVVLLEYIHVHVHLGFVLFRGSGDCALYTVLYTVHAVQGVRRP